MRQQYKGFRDQPQSAATRPNEPPPDYDQLPNNPVDNFQQQDRYPRRSNNNVGREGNIDFKSPVMTSSDGHVTYPDRRKSASIVGEETDILRRSKRASQAMVVNNPDIADLSDTNRPTKIAERFSEFYDNEWTEAFDSLSNKKKTEEKKITQLLLDIVQKAYAFCKKEAVGELEAMHSAIVNILEYGEIKECSKKEPPSDTNLLVQYRKVHASRAVKRLEKVFFETELKPICTAALGGMPPTENGATAKFGRKAVELTWWMCVQDPPVHMVSTTEPFNPDYYKAYTKSGNHPDFFVWPALKLYETGPLMTKGVVQFK